jgi:AcrR family transcriptional regulator
MATRSYVSSVRAAAAAGKREEVLAAAAAFLREDIGIASFSLDAVAKAAGVTRLTVYNQFGSRRGLLEAVFDDIARRGRLTRIAGAMAKPDPRAALGELVTIFCNFWSSDPAIGRLHDAMAIDAEFAQALTERNGRRRKAMEEIVRRLATDKTRASIRRDVVDVLFALTSYAMHRMLSAGRSAKAVRMLVQTAADDAIARIVRL